VSVTHQTLRLTEALRAVVDSHIDAATRDLVRAWVRAWNTIAPEWGRAVDSVVEAAGPGRWPNSRQILELDRVGAALDAATAELERLARLTGVTVVSTAGTVTSQTTQWEARIIASQLPPGSPAVTLLDSRLPVSVLSTIVERTTQQIESRRAPLAHDAGTAMRRALIRGVALGHNPRATAAHMLRTSERHFNGGLSRALNIARTETLDAQRAASAAYQLQHRDVLTGWVWTSKLDARTCPSCWAMHGTVHPLVEPGPHDHQQVRCARTPVTRSWAELGIGIREPASILPDAESRFRRMPRSRQLAVMGPARLAALDNGTLAWSDLAVNRTNPGWRDSWVPVTVHQTRQLAARTA
jgi:SPP1 gp7 family putative phage head morphogenesis protein